MTFLRRIAALVAHHYEIEPETILSRSRDHHVAEARHMVIWLALRHAPPAVSQRRISMALGRKSTFACDSKQIAHELLERNDKFASLAWTLDYQIRRAGIERMCRLSAAIAAELERIPDPPNTSRSLAEQNQRFTQAMRRETEAA